MTATATRRQKGSVALREELARRTSSRDHLLTEIASASEKLEKAIHSGDTSGSVRMQTRLSALEGLSEQEERLISRVASDLAAVEAREARSRAIVKLVSIAEGAAEALRAVERKSAELNVLLQDCVPPILDLQLSLGARKLEFLALARGELGADLAGFHPEAIRNGNELLSELREMGVDLTAVLAYWGGTPSTQGERPYEAPEIAPFGRNIYDLVGTLGHIRSLEVAAVTRREP